MRFEQIMLTPELAQNLLRGNTGNRKVRKTVVVALARDMTAGAYRLNPQPIIIAKSGRVLDGQHRMLACILSGVTIPVFICWDAPEEVQRVLDLTEVRRPADFMAMDGKSKPKLRAAVARQVLVIERNLSNPAQKATNAEIEALEARRPRGFAWFETVAEKYKLTRGAYLAPLVVAAGFAAAEVVAFHASVQSGEHLSTGDPALQLRNLLLAGLHRKSGWWTDTDVLLKSAAALVAAIEGRKLMKLQASQTALDYLIARDLSEGERSDKAWHPPLRAVD